jgi:MFS family permease
MGAAVFAGLWAFPFFALIDTKDPTLILVAMVPAIAIGVAGMFGPQAAYFAELFGARLRYSGFAIARELGSILAGGIVPFVSAWLVASMNGAPWGVAAYIIVMCVITVIALWFGPETYKVDLHDEGESPSRSD